MGIFFCSLWLFFFVWFGSFFVGFFFFCLLACLLAKIIFPSRTWVQRTENSFIYEKIDDNDGYIMGKKYGCSCKWLSIYVKPTIKKNKQTSQCLLAADVNSLNKENNVLFMKREN